MNRPLHRLIAGLLVLSIASSAHAELITHARPTDRERIAAHLNREDVAAELASRGITMEEARVRIAALTDDEAASLAGRIDELPAGGVVPLIAAMVAVAPMVPILIGVAVVGGIMLVVGTVAGVKYMAQHGDAKRQDVASETPEAAPARQPSKWKLAMRADPGAVTAEFRHGVVDSTAFPVSTGLYGAVVPQAR